MRKGLMLLIVGLILPVEASTDPASFNGTFVVDKEASDDISAAFRPVIDEMNLVARTIARRRMRDGIEPDSTVRIQVTEETITVVSGENPPAVAPASGEEIEVSGSGGPATLSTRIEEGILRLRLHGDRGGFESDYSLDRDGQTLFISTTISFNALPRPVSYRLVYRRQ